MEQLSDEIIISILKFVDYTNLICISQLNNNLKFEIDKILSSRYIFRETDPHLIIDWDGFSIPDVNIQRFSVNTITTKKFKFPKLLLHIPNLENIYFTYCKLTNIDDHISELKNLKVLSLVDTLVSEIPKSIGELINLEELNIYRIRLNNGYLKTIPNEVGNLQKLKSINLSKNIIEIIPDSFINLNKIEIINVSKNKIQTFPELNINLKELKCNNNNISVFPETFLNLLNLEILEISNNQIEEIPKDIDRMKSLKNLNLSNNRIIEIPQTIENLKKLQELSIKDNDIENFPIVNFKKKVKVYVDQKLYNSLQFFSFKMKVKNAMFYT